MTANQAKDVVIRIPSYRSNVIPIQEFRDNPYYGMCYPLTEQNRSQMASPVMVRRSSPTPRSVRDLLLSFFSLRLIALTNPISSRQRFPNGTCSSWRMYIRSSLWFASRVDKFCISPFITVTTLSPPSTRPHPHVATNSSSIMCPLCVPHPIRQSLYLCNHPNQSGVSWKLGSQ